MCSLLLILPAQVTNIPVSICTFNYLAAEGDSIVSCLLPSSHFLFPRSVIWSEV